RGLSMSEAPICELTRGWVEEFVLTERLCPFAVHLRDSPMLRIVESAARRESELLDDLADELRRLSETPPSELETSILVHPHCLASFEAQLDFVEASGELLELLGLRGEIQIVAFHPDFRFAGAGPNEAGNFVNRSPFAMLHLLRESSVEAVMGDARSVARAEELSELNARRLEAIGSEALALALARWRQRAV